MIEPPVGPVPTIPFGIGAPAQFQLLHAVAVGVCALGFTFDLGEVVLGTALAAVFSSPPHIVPSSQLSWLLASVYVGAVVGAPLMGALADRRGRRFALIATMLLLTAGSLASSLSSSITALILARGISGVALGAYPPLMIAYLTELIPARRRGAAVMVAVALGYLGPPGTIFLLRKLTPLQPLGWEAWRWLLGIGSLGAACTGALFLLLPEAPRWLAARAAAMGGSEPVLAGPRLWPRFALVAGLSFLSPWATVAFPLLTGVLLLEKGFKLSETLLYVGVSTFGPIAGTLCTAFAADRIGRRTALAACAIGMVATAAVFWLSVAPGWLMAAGVGFNLFVGLYVPALSVYAAELFPTGVRARATARAWAVNRVAAAAGPLLLLPLLHTAGAAALLAVVSVAMLGSVLLLAWAGPPGKAGQPV